MVRWSVVETTYVLCATIGSTPMPSEQRFADPLYHARHKRVAHEEGPPAIRHPGRVLVREHVQAFQFNGCEAAVLPVRCEHDVFES